jgi:hypothetical protein
MSKIQLQEMQCDRALDIECLRAEIADHVKVNADITRLRNQRNHLNERDCRAKDSKLGFISDNDETGAEVDVQELEFDSEVRPCSKLLPAPSVSRTKFFQFFTKVGRVNKQIRRPRGLDLQRAQSGTDSSDENYSSEGEDFQADEEENIRTALLDGYMSGSEKEDVLENDNYDELPGLSQETCVQPAPLRNFEVVIARRRERPVRVVIAGQSESSDSTQVSKSTIYPVVSEKQKAKRPRESLGRSGPVVKKASSDLSLRKPPAGNRGKGRGARQ